MGEEEEKEEGRSYSALPVNKMGFVEHDITPHSFVVAVATDGTAACRARWIATRRPARPMPNTRLLARGLITPFKKCKFQASLCHLGTGGGGESLPDRVVAALADIRSLKRVAKASHPHIYAWQFGTDTGCHDGGERGAGARLLRALQVGTPPSALEQGGVLVAVTRWYGGSHLGGARFRVIEKTALELLRGHYGEGKSAPR